MRRDLLAEALAAPEPVTELLLRDTKGKLVGLERLTSLESVTLTALDDDTCNRLAELPDLTTLQLNNAKEVPASIKKLASVRAVRLVACDALDLAEALPRIAKLATLDSLELNTHTYKTIRNIVQPAHVLPDAFARFTQLRELSVMRGFHPFPPSIGSMTNLESLSIGVNAFDTIPKTIGKLQRLRELDLRSTPITRLPDELCNCAALESLCLLNCRNLTELPREIGRLASLRLLSILQTKIKALPASAAELTELRQFHASKKTRLAVPAGFMADGADDLSGPPELLASITMRPTTTEDEDWLTLDDPDRVPASFGDPRTLRVRLPTYKKPLPQLGKLRSLETLDLELPDLEAAFEQLAGCRALRTLTIHGKHRTLPSSLGKLRGLTSLTTVAPIKTLPAELGQLVNLEELVVCSAIDLPASIGKLAALRTLQLERGSRLPAELSQCRALDSLCVGASTNADLATIASLPALDSLIVLTKVVAADVRRLDLAHLARPLAGRTLSLLKIDGAVEALPPEIHRVQIHRLDLESSKIRTLPAEARDWPALREVVVRSYDASVLKPSLPRGRWRKTVYSSTARYQRSD